ncbi:hypothetical protein VTN02DRAFT_6084 [Thermoascus thermophilus]
MQRAGRRSGAAGRTAPGGRAARAGSKARRGLPERLAWPGRMQRWLRRRRARPFRASAQHARQRHGWPDVGERGERTTQQASARCFQSREAGRWVGGGDEGERPCTVAGMGAASARRSRESRAAGNLSARWTDGRRSELRVTSPAQRQGGKPRQKRRLALITNAGSAKSGLRSGAEIYR